jgi:hypothetical protein
LKKRWPSLPDESRSYIDTVKENCFFGIDNRGLGIGRFIASTCSVMTTEVVVTAVGSAERNDGMDRRASSLVISIRNQAQPQLFYMTYIV